MKEFQERRRVRRIFLSRVVFFALLGLFVLFSFSVFGVYKRWKQAELKNRLVQEELLKLEQRKNELEADLSRLKTDAGVEEELINKFQVKREGEEYIVIIDNGLSGEASASVPQNSSTFEKIKDFVRNIF